MAGPYRSELVAATPSGAPRLLLFLRGGLLFCWGLFLRCVLHRLILPNIKICDSLKRSQCDSYIRLFASKVKKKMHKGTLDGPHEEVRKRKNVEGVFCSTLFSQVFTCHNSAGQVSILAMRQCFSAALLVALVLASSCGPKRRARTPAAPPSLGPETGIASWYGHPYHGRRAANGETYDMEKMTAAHRTLPFETWVRVTNLGNQKFVTVRITDRGPFIDGRIIDLSRAAAREIELIGPGTARVRVEVASRPASYPAERYAIQIGAFQDRERAERIRRQAEDRHTPARLVMRQGDPVLWRVLVGEELSVKEALAVAEKLGLEASKAFVVRLDTSPANGAGATP